MSVVNEVKAKAQSNSLSQIEHLLNTYEIDLMRRARNKIKRYPKSADPSIYSRATGFETLIGCDEVSQGCDESSCNQGGPIKIPAGRIFAVLLVCIGFVIRRR